MNFIKCPKCGIEEPSFDYAHVCGPVEVKSKMNERIRELMMESWKTFPTVFDAEKFADLIVREAIGVVQKRYMGDQNREDMEVRRCVADLKKHFGVE
jgi:hypothetical protein